MDFFLRYDKWSEPQPVTLPPSKSVQARQLVLAALAGARCRFPEAGRSDDIAALKKALKKAGKEYEINVEASGTAFRFMTAYAAMLPGAETLLYGTSYLNRRPISHLVDALRSLGADIRYAEHEGAAPLLIRGKEIEGGDVRMSGAVSSQFVSALLLVAPYMKKGLTLHLTGRNLPSSSYISMTRHMMHVYGVDTESRRNRTILVPPGRYRLPPQVHVEDDWSAAAFFYEYAAISGKPVILCSPGDPSDSWQGDAAVASLYRCFGVETEVMHGGNVRLVPTGNHVRILDINMHDCLDLVPAFAVTAAMLRIPFRISGVANLRHKECNRIEAISAELLKLGRKIRVSESRIEWDGNVSAVHGCPVISTYSDHRITMAFSMAAPCFPSIVISDIHTVKKSYPKFWHQMSRLGIRYSPSSSDSR